MPEEPAKLDERLDAKPCEPPKPPRTWRRRLIWMSIALLALAVWLVGFGGYPLIQWSPLNCTHEEIDIRAGRIRATHILLGMRISERTEDSALTKALSPADLPSAEPDWQRVNTFSPGVHHSPHYWFHGAISQAHYYQQLCDYYHFSPQTRREVALGVLQLWHEKGGSSPASRYLYELELKLSKSSDKPTDEFVRSASAEVLTKIRGEKTEK